MADTLYGDAKRYVTSRRYIYDILILGLAAFWLGIAVGYKFFGPVLMASYSL